MHGLCECGCGQITNVSRHTDKKRGYVCGTHVRFIVGHNQKALDRPAIGYTQRSIGRSKTRLEHQIIAERVLGRPLPQGAQVHHVDGDGTNNAYRNLVICQDTAYHQLLHLRARIAALGGNPNTDYYCTSCKQCLPYSHFYRRSAHRGLGLLARCKECRRKSDKGRWRGGPVS